MIFINDTMSATQIVAVANDITFNSGAFGPQEDAVFRAATEHALAERLPLVYLAANSGARVGLASEVKKCLQVSQVQQACWLLKQVPLQKPAADIANNMKSSQ